MRVLIDECLDPVADMIGDFQGGMTDLEQRTLESLTGGGYGRLPALPSETREFLLEPGDGIYISPRLAHTVDKVWRGSEVPDPELRSFGAPGWSPASCRLVVISCR